MSLDEAINNYIARFGGFPYFNVMGMPDDAIIEKIEESIRSGKEIKPEEGRVY